MSFDRNRPSILDEQKKPLVTKLPLVVVLLAGCFIGCTSFASPSQITTDLINFGNDSDSAAEFSASKPSQETGQETIGQTQPTSSPPASSENSDDTPTAMSITEKGEQLFLRLSGQQQESGEQAKDFYQRANRHFEIAAEQTPEQAKETFNQAAELFHYAGDLSPGTALQQDAMFMRGESLFFADRLVDASDVYERLQKEFPRNRHIDKVAARLFSISRYWIDVAKANQGNLNPVNLTDPKYPKLDVDGHAIRVLDQIRFDDPTGRLADDATLAAALEYMRQEKYQEADEFLTDLRETFTDSEHLFVAHLLGINVKMQTYRGPKYSGLALEDAEKLVKQTRQRFPDKLRDNEDDSAKRLEDSASKIAFLQAERLRYRAEYREKRKEYGAASYYYNLLLTKYPDTPHAANARERLAATEKKPRRPIQRLSWLTTVFPDSTAKSAPLELNGSSEPVDGSSETLLR